MTVIHPQPSFYETTVAVVGEGENERLVTHKDVEAIRDRPRWTIEAAKAQAEEALNAKRPKKPAAKKAAAKKKAPTTKKSGPKMVRVKSDEYSNHGLPIGATVQFYKRERDVDWYTMGGDGDEVAIDPRDLDDVPPEEATTLTKASE